jgi:hypothetical protein
MLQEEDMLVGRELAEKNVELCKKQRMSMDDLAQKEPLYWPNTVMSRRASGCTPSICTIVAWPVAFENVSWRRFQPTCSWAHL